MRSPIKKTSCAGVAAVLCGLAAVSHAEPAKTPAQPRIVNIYNFIRNSDYRMQDSENIMFETTRKQIELIKPTGLPATWALQYDALINPRYQALLKEQVPPNHEIAAWWEIPRPLVVKAGIKWRGHNHEWDSTANIGFSPGYTPDERRKLVDVYMEEFKNVFGRYPKSAGSWFIDEITLDHMVKRYGIVASCNCKDQVGTDGYTLWGGYWNQAYYPSRLNSYMPAQTKSGQIDVPVFRMLGSDPIYQYGRVHGMFTLEPVYGNSGGSEKWVNWFMKNLIEQSSLAFAWTQAGQENSFGWDGMKNGLSMQIPLLEKQSKAGEIQVMTLQQSGEWFRKHHPLTPPTSMVCIDDWKNEGRRTVWYNSRFYRTNLLWEKDSFFIRDLHRFDEKVVSVTHDKPLTTSHLAYGTLPVMDGSLWSEKQQVAIRPVILSDDGAASPVATDGAPVVKELNKTDLAVSQNLTGGGMVHLVFRENSLTCTAADAQGKPLRWALDIAGGEAQDKVVREVSPAKVVYQSEGTGYELRIANKSGAFQRQPDGVIRTTSNDSGKIILSLGGY